MRKNLKPYCCKEREKESYSLYKKIISYFIIIITIITTFMIIFSYKNFTFCNTTTDENGITWLYTVKDGKAVSARIYRGTPKGETFRIPSKLDNYEVTSICGENRLKYGLIAKYNMFSTEYNNVIKRIEIPSTVTEIGYSAFYYCVGLEEVIIERDDDQTNRNIEIGAYAFSQCTNLKTIDFTGVTTIGECGFNGCTNITEVKADSITTIGDYAFNRSGLKKIHLGSNAKTIGKEAFNGCTDLEQVVLSEGLTLIKEGAFKNCINLRELSIPNSVTSIEKDFVNESGIEYLNIGSGLTSIMNFNCESLRNITVSEDNNSYSSEDGILFDKNKLTLIKCPPKAELGDYDIPNTVTRIGESAFYKYNGSIGKITIPNSVITIGNSAFSNSTFTGDLIIPDSVTSIGESAFLNCSKFNGILSIGKGITTIPNSAFAVTGAKTFTKASISSSVTNIGRSAFDGFSDIWIDNTKENVKLDENFGTKQTYIHWANDTHKVQIGTMEGVNLINIDTGDVITSGEYDCEKNFSYKVQIEEGYDYSNLKMIEINDNNIYDVKITDVNTEEVYTFERLLRPRTIYVKDFSQNFDLSLRMFITAVNEVGKGNRAPDTNFVQGKFQYLHTKQPIEVKQGDIIRYNIRVYNEGGVDGTATKISVHIPEGLEFDSSISTNDSNGWVLEEDGKISTTSLKEKSIRKYDGQLHYEDIPIALKVGKNKENEEKTKLNVIAEIESESNNDYDSTPGSITSAILSDTQEEESLKSNEQSYIAGQEDDDDFESVEVTPNIKVGYEIKITEEQAKLQVGDEYKLIKPDGEQVSIKNVIEGGILDFGTITTYGAGEDVYYIERVEKENNSSEVPNTSPEVKKVIKKIKVTVTKTNIGKAITRYDIIDYDFDIDSLEFIPIYNVEDLKKIGSNENGTCEENEQYTFAPNANYKLMEDITLTEKWVPLESIVSGVIDGNNHKIINLAITPNEQGNMGDIGLFRAFSGTVKDLTFENVDINIDAFQKDVTKKMNYTGVGALAGVMSSGSIINCHVSGSISSKNDNAGGLVGQTIGKIQINNCSNSAQVVSNGKSNAGGLIGCALSSIEVLKCSNLGEITTGSYNAGGLVGYAGSPSGDTSSSTANVIFANCTNESSISGYSAAGIIGTSYYRVNIENCINNGSINASNSRNR